MAVNHERFTDWHIDTADTIQQSVAFPGQLRVNSEMEPIALNIAAGIKEFNLNNPQRDRFTVTVDGYRYRVQHVVGMKYAVRRISETPDFETLKYPVPLVNLLCRKDITKTGGLILIAGPAGSGKTSTGVCTLKKRLVDDGGFALTVEDPPEFVVRGFHGEKGYCEQMDVTDIGFEKGLTKSLRSFPSKTSCMLFFGEVREKSAAAELLRIAIDGHLVITTTHAKDITTALTRLITLASSDGEDEARYLLASSLKMVVFQSLEAVPSANGSHDNSTSILKTMALEVDDVAASIIRNKNQDMNLRDLISRTGEKLRANQYAPEVIASLGVKK